MFRAFPRSEQLRFRFSGTPRGHRLSWACVLCPSQVRVAQAASCLASALSPVGPASYSPSGSQLLGFPGALREHRLRCTVCLLWGAGLRLRPCILLTFQVPAPWFPGCAAGAPSQVCRVSPLGSWSQAATLLVDVNHPGAQEDLVSNWEPAHSLVEDAGLWG